MRRPESHLEEAPTERVRGIKAHSDGAAAPGSTLDVVWQQDRYAREVIGTRVALGDMFRSLAGPGTNILLIKTSFWVPVR
jgi:hypothetical protein